MRKNDKSKPKEASTRDRLLKAALTLFSAKGYDGASTKEICELAEANIAAVAYHFGTKENLLETIFVETITQDSKVIGSVLREAESLPDFKMRLRLFCETLMDIVESAPEFHRLLRREAATNPVAFRIFQREIRKLNDITDRFFEAAKKKRIIADDVEPDTVALLIHGILAQGPEGQMHRKLNPKLDLSKPANRAAYLDKMLNVVFHGILTTGAPDA